MEDPAQSHHPRDRVTDKDLFDNRLLFGDNLFRSGLDFKAPGDHFDDVTHRSEPIGS